MDNEKLKDNSVFNETKWPEIFGLTEKEVLEIREAFYQYQTESNNPSSYKDLCKMYNGVHKESTGSAGFRHWLACVRWLRSTPEPLSEQTPALSTTEVSLSEQNQERETVNEYPPEWHAAYTYSEAKHFPEKGSIKLKEAYVKIKNKESIESQKDFKAGAQWKSQNTAKQIKELTNNNFILGEEVSSLNNEKLYLTEQIDQYKARIGELEAESKVTNNFIIYLNLTAGLQLFKAKT